MTTLIYNQIKQRIKGKQNLISKTQTKEIDDEICDVLYSSYKSMRRNFHSSQESLQDVDIEILGKLALKGLKHHLISKYPYCYDRYKLDYLKNLKYSFGSLAVNVTALTLNRLDVIDIKGFLASEAVALGLVSLAIYKHKNPKKVSIYNDLQNFEIDKYMKILSVKPKVIGKVCENKFLKENNLKYENLSKDLVYEKN